MVREIRWPPEAFDLTTPTGQAHLRARTSSARGLTERVAREASSVAFERLPRDERFASVAREHGPLLPVDPCRRATARVDWVGTGWRSCPNARRAQRQSTGR